MTRTPRLLLSATLALWASPAMARLQPSPVCDLTGTHSVSVLDRGDASLRAKRAFVWDGDRLAGEAGLAFDKGVIWRTQYVPGPDGGNAAPQVRVETDLRGTPQQALYALLRDEQGSVIAVAPDTPVDSTFPVLARVLYTPYGEAHLETGPELLRIASDRTLTTLGGESQTLPPVVPPATEPTHVGGGVRIGTTVPLTLESAATGLRIERWEAGTSAWVVVDRAGWVVARAATSEDDAELGVMPKEGFRKGERYRLTVTSDLADAFGRAMQLPPGAPSSGVALLLDIPTSGDLPEAGATFNLTFDTVVAASSTLGQRFPGGLTSLFGGAWTDPVTGLVLDGGQWYDPRNATYLDEDPGADPLGSLYAFAGGAPHTSGAFTLGIPASPDWSWAEGMSGAPWDPDIMGNAVPGYRAAARVLANTRVQGGLMVAGGVMEAGVAPMTGAAAPFVALHAADVASAGLVQMITGEATSTYTHRIIAAGARAAGASSGTAEQVGAWGDFAVGMVGPAIAIRAEMAAMRLPVVLGREGLGWGETGTRLWRPPFDNEVPTGLKGIGKPGVLPPESAINPRLQTRLAAWKGYAAGGGQMDMSHWVRATKVQYGDVSGVSSGYGAWLRRVGLAGEDSLYLYQKVGPAGEHLKFGVTKNLLTRYSQRELAGGRLRRLAFGPRSRILALERQLHDTLPLGPEEGQRFYRLIQQAKGLRP